MKQIEFQIRGTVPLLMHNGQLANPLNAWTQQLNKLKGKRNKTEEDHREYGSVQWFGGLYTSPNITPEVDGLKGARVVIPSDNIDRMMILAARKFKFGKQFESGVFSSEISWPLGYNGPKSIGALAADQKFADWRMVVIQRSSRVLSCRPIFTEWALTFTLNYDGVEEVDVRRAMDIAGECIGLCDYRPRFGRFEVVEL